MAKPTITYGEKYVNDCDDDTNWNEAVAGMGGAEASLTVDIGDVFNLSATADDAGDEHVYYRKDISPNVDGNIYSNFLIRWKTSVGSNGFGAKVIVEYDDASWEALIGGTNPEFSTTWKVTAGEMTSHKTIDAIKIFADDYPNSFNGGVGNVYYDFIMFYDGIFTFPHVAPGGIQLAFPNRHVHLGVPGRGSPITQYIGANEPITITLRGDMKNSETWGSANYKYGEYLLKVWRNQFDAPFHWFTSDRINCKVTAGQPVLRQTGENSSQCVYDYPLALYSLSDINESEWDDLQWLGIEV